MPRKPVALLKQPVQQRSKHTVEAILQAAIQVFEAHGYASGTTARIAERAGVSVGTLYQYFPNKAAVVAALAQRHVNDIRSFAEGSAVQGSSSSQSTSAMLDTLVEGFVAMHEKNPALHRLMSTSDFLLDETRKELARIRRASAVQLAEFLADRRDIRRGDSQVMAHILIECLEHFTHTLVLTPPPQSLRLHVAAELKFLLKRYVLKE